MPDSIRHPESCKIYCIPRSQQAGRAYRALTNEPAGKFIIFSNEGLAGMLFPVIIVSMHLPKLTLADLARSGHVTRWHSVRTSRDQTLAEHHYMVTRISNRLAKDILGADLDDSGLLKIMEYASLHDTPELLMGDLPSPLKRHIEQISGKNNPITAIENEIAPWLAEMKDSIRRTNPEYLLIVKLADIMDALVFITEEGIGTHAGKVIQILEGMLSEKLSQAEREFSQYNWNHAMAVLSELQQKGDESKMAFEQG
jgi:5'-deoxynucleotidase